MVVKESFSGKFPRVLKEKMLMNGRADKGDQRTKKRRPQCHPAAGHILVNQRQINNRKFRLLRQALSQEVYPKKCQYHKEHGEQKE